MDNKIENGLPTQQPERQEGASMVEYALLVALIAVIAIVAIRTLGTRISSQFSATATQI